MRTILKESLPIPDSIPGPEPVVFFINAPALLARAMRKNGVETRICAGYTTRRERVRALLGIAKMTGAKRAFEIGTCAGGTSANLYFAGMHVETLDLPQPQDVSRGVLGAAWSEDWIPIPHGRFFIRALGLPIVTHVGDSRTWRPWGLEKTFDLVFVDGDHSFAMVENDTLLALELIRPGGTIVWDDYAIPDVTRFLDGFEREHGEIVVVVTGDDPDPAIEIGSGLPWPIAYWTDPT